MTANAFARHLGLPRGENLYQIKRGNNGISCDLARRIHAQYPNYSLSWLLTGEGEAGSGIGATVALPFCGTYGRWNRLRAGAVSGLVSSWAACGAEVAVACPDGVPGTGLRSPILLLRRCDPAGPLLYDNLYLVELAGMRLLRTVDAGGDDGTLRLSREGCGDTLVDRTAVASLWFVCAAIDRLVRQGAFRIVASRSVPSFLVTFCLSCPVLFRPVPSYPAPLFRRDRRSFIQRRPVRPDCRVHHSPTRRGKSELNMKNVICSSVLPVQSIPSSSVPPKPTELYSTSSRPPGLPGTQPDESPSRR